MTSKGEHWGVALSDSLSRLRGWTKPSRINAHEPVLSAAAACQVLLLRRAGLLGVPEREHVARYAVDQFHHNGK